MCDQKRILVVDDNPEICTLLSKYLRMNGYDVATASNNVQAFDMIENFKPTLIFLDLVMPERDGIEVLKEMKQRRIDIPVIIITGNGSMETAIWAVQLGVYDYLTKPLDLKRIQYLTKRCLEESGYKAELNRSKTRSSETGERYNLIGSSPAMVAVYKTVGSVSMTDNDTNVLILGDSGTGKELVARQIHIWGKHPNSPFIALNMTALPDMLIESELFGYEKGAFTGATQAKPGLFRQAGDGIIFLDEIGSISHNLQLKLLRVLQEREYYMLGGHNVHSVRCRIIAATNENLESRVRSGEFRKDLYFRLKIVSICLPSLSQRREDIPTLTMHFVNKYSEKLKRRVPEIPKGTINFLTSRDWSGNVRELENMIARALAVSHRNRLLPEDFSEMNNQTESYEPPILHISYEKAKLLLVEAFERMFIKSGLKHSKGNISKMADRAGISRQCLYKIMKKYNISASSYK